MGHDWAEFVGLASPDIFMGGVYIWNIGYWRNIPLPDGSGRYYIGYNRPPMASLVTLDKKRVQIMGYETDNYNDGIRSLCPSAMKHDGFEHVFPVVVTGDDASWPNINPEWFGKMLDLLESVKPMEMHSTTRPATDVPDTADRMLQLAQAYISSGRTDLAQSKLETLIQTYPNDPAAAKAKDLLSEIAGSPAEQK